jgi:hypothetical protein
MKAASLNRMTKIRVFEKKQCVKTIPNASINYGQDIENMKKMLVLAIRLCPEDPCYTIDKVFIEIGEGKYSEMDQDKLMKVQNMRFSSAAGLATKVSLKVDYK